MSYMELLETWYQRERAAGRIQDVKFFPIEESYSEERAEALAKVIYEIVTGQVETEPVDISTL